jgi:hypothetical protein
MFREVTMVELKEVLRLWGEGLPKKRLAAQLGLDPKTVNVLPGLARVAGRRRSFHRRLRRPALERGPASAAPWFAATR